MKKELKIIKPITEDEMVTIFLKGEISSQRFGHLISDALEHENINRKIIDNPDIKSTKENTERKKILTIIRGYDTKESLFDNFPDDVKWYRAKITKEGLKKVKYINYSYWVGISKGTRFAKDAVKTIHSGEEIFGESNDIFWKTAEAVKRGVKLPEMILVGTDKNSQLIVLEGHLRTTGYLLNPKHTPDELDVIVGFSEKIKDFWGYY